MKKSLLASAALLVCASMPAYADGGMVDGGTWYAGLSAGMNDLDGTSVETTGNNALASFETGWALSAAIGYRWIGGLRAEIEGSYRSNDADSIFFVPASVAATNVEGDVTQYSVMANVLYDVKLSSNFILSLGAGAGLASADVDVQAFGVPVVVDNGDTWSFAWQLIGGIGYSMSPNTEFFVEYRYMRSDDHDVTTFPAGTPLDTSADAKNQSVMGGVRFAFGR